MKFYHATTKKNMEKIVEDGVIKSCGGAVFLCRKALDSCKFLAIRGMDKMSVIEVQLKMSEVTESFDHSQAFFQCRAYMHAGDIVLSGNEKIWDYELKF